MTRPACTTSARRRLHPDETIARVRAAVTAHGARFETYEGANHAFDNPMPAFHHPEASAAAWAPAVVSHHLNRLQYLRVFPRSARASRRTEG